MADEQSGDKSSIAPASTAGDRAIDVAAAVTSAVPWIGGPISAVLSGIGTGRRIARVRQIAEGMAEDLRSFKREASEMYVQTDEFEELLERTLRQAAEERDEEKRQLYRAFLVNDIKMPGEPYTEKVRFLKTLEELQPAHVRLLKALQEEPRPTDIIMGSPSQTLMKRLGWSSDVIDTRALEVERMGLAALSGLHTVVTGHGAEDLRGRVTPYGRRLLRFITKD